jgi:hypothetical protein
MPVADLHRQVAIIASKAWNTQPQPSRRRSTSPAFTPTAGLKLTTWPRLRQG